MKALLKKYFGYDEFRPQQLEIINNVLEKKDTLVLMPTGGGKSLCFQIPALLFNGVTIVISPLMSLMKDQVDALKLNGIDAEYINSSLSKNEIDDIKSRMEKGDVKIVYVTPERLALKSFKTFLENINVSLIAIDEAHCISEWGHDFRKDYRNLKFLKKEFVGVPIIALTATATSKVKKDILKQLNLTNPTIFTSSFNRENLNLIVRDKKNSFAQILALLEKHENESAIIYCYSRNDTKTLADNLKMYGFKALAYHAGMSDTVRDRNQEMFINDKVNIMVATIAFGMGIDKSNVRLVIHDTFSKSIEGYYQEIGRAGRDGLSSDCVLFYSEADKRKHNFFIEMLSTATQKKESSSKLNEMMNFCENRICRKKFVLEYFGEKFERDNCGACDVCLNLTKVNTDPVSNSLKKRTKNYDTQLFKELKVLRESVADERKVPPSNVFSDVSLREMAKVFPKTEKDFMEITGVGDKKLKDFGEDFLMHINEYLMVNEIAGNLKEDIIKLKPVVKKTYKKKKYYSKKKKTYKKKANKFKKS